MKKSLLVVVLALAMLLSLSSLFGQLKPILQEVYDFGGSFPANVIYPADGTISYTTYVTSRPADVQAGPTPLCTARMSSGRFLLEFNMGNFDNPWTAGDILRIEVLQAGTGRLASVEFALEGGNLPQARFDGLSMVLENPPVALFNSNDGDPILNEGLVMAPGYPLAGVYRATGWGLNDDWNIQFSTEGFENITLTSKIRRQYWFDDEDTFEDYWGPRLFRTYYSTNGTEWTQYPVVNYTLGANEDWLTIAFDIPDALWGLPNLQIKWELFNINGISNDGWGEIKDVLVTGDEVFVPPTDHTISGNFTTTTWDFAGISIAATGIDNEDIVINPVTGEYTITVPDGWTGIVTPTKDGYIITPAMREYLAPVVADIEDQDFAITKNVDPVAPVITSPEEGHTFLSVGPLAVTITWAPGVGYAPEGYEISWSGADWTDVGTDLEFTTEELVEGPYMFSVRGYINTPMGKSYTPTRTKITDRAVVSSAKGNGPAATVNFSVEYEEVYQFYPEDIYPIGTITVQVMGAGFVGGNEVVDPVINPVTNPTFIATTQGVLELIGTGEVTILINCPDQWFVYNIGAGWVSIAGPLVDYPLVINLGNKDAQMEYKSGNGGDPTLPVELSSFNAVLTAQYFVKLTWISQSETNLNGYRVYRSENTELVNATMITPIIISATNTSSTQVYSIEDREVAFGNTYWYWLESVENDGSSAFHGPTSVFVEGEVPPVLPQATTMRSAYPNPFKAASTTTIEVAVKEGESGSLTIYNVLGQVVKTYSLNQGIHNLKWNGKDNKGNICSSGIYFYKLSTPTMNQTKKMVIVK